MVGASNRFNRSMGLLRTGARAHNPTGWGSASKCRSHHDTCQTRGGRVEGVAPDARAPSSAKNDAVRTVGNAPVRAALAGCLPTVPARPAPRPWVLLPVV